MHVSTYVFAAEQFQPYDGSSDWMIRARSVVLVSLTVGVSCLEITPFKGELNPKPQTKSFEPQVYFNSKDESLELQSAMPTLESLPRTKAVRGAMPDFEACLKLDIYGERLAKYVN